MIPPFPREPLQRALVRYREEHLPELRQRAIPPCRHPQVTLLIYWYPAADEAGHRPIIPCEFALRQTLCVLGQLPTVIVTNHTWLELNDLAHALGATIQEEPTLTPGSTTMLSQDCIQRLHTRFTTSHVLIVQPDGWPLRDELDNFLGYDYVGAPSVKAGWRERIADGLGLTVLNGGFSLRSQRLCKAVAHRWQTLWRHCLKPESVHAIEDIFTTRTLRLCDPTYRLRYRIAPSPVARNFSVDCLDGALPVELQANPMGFHGPFTAKAFLDDRTHLTVVSVVRDFEMYDRCIKNNPHLAGARLVAFDNREDNLPIPVRYNAFLDALPADTEWILFAHEDFELREDPRPLLARRNPLLPLGHIGTRRVGGLFLFPSGFLTDSWRDGSGHQVLNPTWLIQTLSNGKVECFDCCGFYLHVDALRAWKLRFDERCMWDMYAEDICCQFMLASKRIPGILPAVAHHWSRGNTASPTFLAAKAYLDEKYCDHFFAGGTCTFSIGKTPPLHFRLYRRLIRLIFFWHFRSKHTATRNGTSE